MGGISFETLALAKKYTDQKQFGESGADLGISGATIGQTIQVAAVDESGAPIRWQTVDLPSKEDIIDGVLDALPTATGVNF